MSLINTRLLELRAKAGLDKFELRPSQYGALDLFMTQSKAAGSMITPELEQKAMVSIDNTLKIPVIDYDAGVTIGNTRSATIADDENTSQMVTISFATYSWGFTIVPSMYDNNEIDMQRDFERKFLKYLYKLGATLDAVGVAAINTARSQVFNNLLLYSNLGNTVKATYAQREDIIGDLGPLLFANDFFGQVDVLGNEGVMSVINKLAQSGIMNAENKQLQYMDKVLHFSSRVPNATGRYATGFAIQPGSLGMLFRFEREAINKRISATGHEWDISTLPLLGIPVGTYFYPGVGDYNAIGGASTASFTRAYKEHYGFAVDIAFITAYNSSVSTLPSPYIKFSINRSEVDADVTAPAVSTVVSAAKTAAVVTFSEALCSDTAGTLLTGDVAAYLTSPATGSTTCTLTSVTADATGKVWTFVIVAGDVAATDTFDLALPVYDANGNALVATTSIIEMNAGATAWEKP
jgi:hypothetical protein